MSVRNKTVYLITFFLGAWITWEILCLVRTQILVSFSGGRVGLFELTAEGLFIVEGIGILIWIVAASLPVLFVADTIPRTIDTIIRGRNAALVFCAFGLAFSLIIFFILSSREEAKHYQNLSLTKTLLPGKTESRFIPARYTQLKPQHQISESGRRAVDALVLGQIFGAVTIALIFWLKFSDKVLNKDEYADGAIDWFRIMREFHDNDPPEDEDELEF